MNAFYSIKKICTATCGILPATMLLMFLLLIIGTHPAMADTGKLMAGTAKINITPKTDEPIHDSVYARSLVLDLNGKRLAFVSVDLVIFTSYRIEQVCKEKYGISKVILCSSHDHSGPMVDNKINFSLNSPFQSFYEDQVIQVIGDAVGHLFPAKIAAGKSTFPQLGFNRLIVREDGHAKESWLGDAHYKPENPERIPFGPVDAELGVLKITDMQGNPRAIITNYAMHADVVCFNYAVSADYPGVAARKVEEAFGNKVNCLFVQGGGGNIESLLISPRRSGPTDAVQTNYAPMERTGELLAWETVKLANNIIIPASSETDIKYMVDSLHFTGRYDTKRDFDVHIITLLINNNISIAICPGEMFVQFQLDWKDKMKQASANGFLFGYSFSGGKWPGYIADVRSAALGGYGADGG
ncbi:MAG TPA: neutral/alkaline non-lysosomal ceramidase N-terminal domain-containing protein, partial [Mucilaginibacter sp.]